ncbi:glutaminase [Clostridium perfringens]|uniref:glutaminase n=1 Tax=Clostridium perfringens TaxID=1502 RepID=UPI001A1F7C77|nr:glutaminase [Clostridium perfringens]HAT4243983.1 glutaminase [Clostridium perfringens]
MSIFLKHKSKFIFFLTFIIVTITIIAIIFKGDVPINKPSIKITYNNEKVSTINGEFNWFNKETGGNSTFAEPIENLKEPLYAKGGEKIEIRFSKGPNSVVIQDISISPYKDYKLLKEESNKEFSFMLPEEKGEYVFQVDGIWDSTHNVSKIFKVYID